LANRNPGLAGAVGDEAAGLVNFWQERAMRLNQVGDLMFSVEEHPVFVIIHGESGERRLQAPDWGSDRQRCPSVFSESLVVIPLS
jgi:hypothetical protein